MISLRRQRTVPAEVEVVGTARLQRRTGELTQRLRPGDIAVIDRVDLDRRAADALVAAGVAAVVNTAPSLSGRYPALGAGTLVAAGVAVVDDVGDGVFAAVRDGDRLCIAGDTIYLADGRVIGSGRRQTADSVTELGEHARAGMSDQLIAFAADASEFVRREHPLLLDGVGLPDLQTVLRQRPVLLVTDGPDARAELRQLRAYIRDRRPVLVGVSAGADVLLQARLTPHLIVADLSCASASALRCGAELVVPGTEITAPMLGIAQEAGARPVLFPVSASDVDAALLLAEGSGAALIVTVGLRTTLVDIVDGDRDAMASMFLTRLRVADRVVDARAVALLHRPAAPTLLLALLVLAAIAAIVATLVLDPSSPSYARLALSRWHELAHWLHGLWP